MKAGAVLTVCLVSLGVIMAGLIRWSVAVTDAHRAQCEAAGGVYFTPRNGSMCIRREAVIEL
jgi:hypothetical protein